MSESIEETIAILMIDDDADDALLAGKLLSGVHAPHYHMEWAKTAACARNRPPPEPTWWR